MIAIDTNVLVYYVDSAEDAKQQQARRFIDELRQARVEPILPWQVAVEFLSCMRRWESAGRISRADTIRYFGGMEEWFEFAIPTRLVLHTALDLNSRHSLSHWDSLLIAACIEAGVTTLYSEDMQDGADYDGVRVVNPFRVTHSLS